ncbi:unnamed protein product [Dibothriocephalus latus]|uniref:Uncharacterized protein n=1 Tax=Dibothriocephalus latus TaxID=60516 RepID=A0A3P7LRV3_DIBLA|nr:unnamed protein product [Dibothriocephalus latus]
MEDVSAIYPYFSNGCQKVERCEAGIAFAIPKNFTGKVPYLVQGSNDHTEETNMDAPPIVVMASTALLSRPESSPPRRAGENRDLRRRWLYGARIPSLRDEAPTKVSEETIR